MSKTKTLRRAIRDLLLQNTQEVYFGQAAADHGQQYLVCDLEELSYTDDQHLCELEVNCMGYGRDTSAVEELADDIQAALDHKVVHDDGITFVCYSERRQPVYEEDRNIIRRRLTFEIHLYERG